MSPESDSFIVFFKTSLVYLLVSCVRFFLSDFSYFNSILDMFPHKITKAFQQSGFLSQLPKSPEIHHFMALIYLF